MSTREMAIELVSSLSDEQVKRLIEFIKGFTGKANEESNKKEVSTKEKTEEEKRRAFEKLDQLVRENSHYLSDIGYDDKETLAALRKEKYGL